MARSEDGKSPLAVASYTKDMFVARERDNGKKGYGVTLIFDKKADLSVLHNLALSAATEEWGAKAAQMIKDGVIKSPFLDGDSKQGKTQDGAQRAELAGKWFIRCTSGADFKPKVFDRKRNPIMDAEDCPSGSTGFGVVNAYTWEDQRNGKGISFGISLFQVVHKAEGDEILGGAGGPDPDKWLETIDDEGDAPKETKGGAGAAGLFG